jgi:hypothetical protein
LKRTHPLKFILWIIIEINFAEKFKIYVFRLWYFGIQDHVWWLLNYKTTCGGCWTPSSVSDCISRMSLCQVLQWPDLKQNLNL